MGIFNDSGIYNGPGLYKTGAEGGGGMAIKESILDMADDWEDVSDQFITNNASVRDVNNNILTVSEYGILYSKKLQIIYFSKYIYLVTNAYILKDNAWHGTILLKQNSRFYDRRDNLPNVHKMDFSQYVFPSNISRGDNLYILHYLDNGYLRTSDWLASLTYTGPGNGSDSDNGIAAKVYVKGDVAYVNAIPLGNIIFYATERV